MTIQIPNPGTGNGATGDNEFVLWSKVKDNFSDQTNAASRLLGNTKDRVPLVQDVYKAAAVGDWVSITDTSTYTSADNFPVGSQFSVSQSTVPTMLGLPQGLGTHIWGISTTSSGHNTAMVMQTAVSQYSKAVMAFRIKGASLSYGDWIPIGYNPIVYSTTTASGANVVVDTAGKLMRSTSSERYKDILAPLELDDARYADAMSLHPIVYRSTADADNPAYHYYSFSAEELGAYDPAFTLWRDTETVVDADGNLVEQPLAERQAEGININALLAMGHAIAIKQHKLIGELEARIEALELKSEV